MSVGGPRDNERVKHQFLRDKKGRVDNFAYDVEAETTGHNGPRCTVCGDFFCEHCEPERYDEECPGEWLDEYTRPDTPDFAR